MVPPFGPRVRIPKGDHIDRSRWTKMFQEIGGFQTENPEIFQAAPCRLSGDFARSTQKSFHGDEVTLRFPLCPRRDIDAIPSPKIKFQWGGAPEHLRPQIGREQTLTGKPRVESRAGTGFSAVFFHRDGPETCPRSAHGLWQLVRFAWLWREHDHCRFSFAWQHPHRPRPEI